MKWKEEYSIGIEEIDSQHQTLLKMFAAIEHSIDSTGTWSDIHYGLIKLKEFANVHFMLEQALMRMYGYPQIASHMASHKHFFDTLNEMEHRSLGVTARQETIRFLSDWFTDHICKTDQLYAEYILSGAPIVRARS